MTAFVGPYPNNMIIDHKDNDRANNRLDNLHYVTFQINNLNKLNTGSCGKLVRQTNLDGKVVKLWDSVAAAAEAMGITRRDMSRYCHNRKQFRQSFWEYVEDSLNGELWKSVQVTNGKLEVSNLGRVRTGVFCANYGGKNAQGYRRVMAGGKEYRIHCLVCEAFNGKKPSADSIVNHKDENKGNNRAENLEWTTVKGNTEYSCAREVHQYTIEGNLIAKYISIIKASEATGLSTTYIGNSCRNCRKGDYIFRYAEDSFELVESKAKAKIGKAVAKYANNVEICRYKSIAEATRLTGIRGQAIKNACESGKLHKGLIWKKIDKL